MTTGEKVAALNNLETICSSAIAYTDSITHSSSYYSKSECNARYFTSATDGSGSGLVAATLGGMSAQAIIDSGTPSGCIGMWSSTKGSIPAGWLLCDGTNSTPNLQDRFIVGAGGNYTNGNVGGVDTVTVTGTITIAGHALTAAETPLHTHGSITDYYGSSNATCIAYTYITPVQHAHVSGSNSHASHTGYSGSGDSHGHTASFAGTANQDKRPPFYALCYIRKI